jgi:hypothetical protein
MAPPSHGGDRQHHFLIPHPRPPQFNLVAAFPGAVPAPSMQRAPTPGGGHDGNKNPTNNSPATAHRAMHTRMRCGEFFFQRATDRSRSSKRGRAPPQLAAGPEWWRAPQTITYLFNAFLQISVDRGVYILLLRRQAVPREADLGIYFAAAAPGGTLRGRPSPAQLLTSSFAPHTSDHAAAPPLITPRTTLHCPQHQTPHQTSNVYRRVNPALQEARGPTPRPRRAGGLYI